MAFTFDITTTLGKVRSLYGDTNSSAPILDDTQVQFAIDQETTTVFAGQLYAAARCADMCAAKFAVQIDRSGQTITTTKSQLFTHFTELAKSLREQAAELLATGPDRTSGAEPKLGGVSVQEAEDLLDDDDYIRPIFSRGQYDNEIS